MLRRKLFRDILQKKSQFITIFLMTMIGIMVYSGIEAYMDGMTQTADKFYGQNNLFDLNVSGPGFSKDDLKEIKKLNHVKNAERKISLSCTTDKKKTLLANFIESNKICKFFVYKGEAFDARKSGVWLDNFYAKENKIKVGDTILVKYDGFKLKEKVRGLVNVPDHLYDVRDESELYPDRKAFGFAYMSVREIPKQYRAMIPYTSVMVDVDYKSNVDKVKNSIEDNIESALAIVKDKDTPSYVTYQGEIDEGKTYVGVFSGLFVFIAMLSVVTTMNRIVKRERIQIGTLKALGFSNKKVLMHYMSYGFVVSLLAAICGMVLGYFFIGKVFMNMQMSVFEIPNGVPVMSYKSYIMAALVMLGVILISYLSCRKILRENAAETLRSKIPSFKRNSLNITRTKIFNNMKFATKWNIRDILRNKMRTLMGLAGVIGCCMLIVCALGMLDSMNHFVDLQFRQLYNFEYKLALKNQITPKDADDLMARYGNKTSKTLGIEIEKNGKREANNIVVTDAGNYLRFVDRNDNYVKINSDKGVYITSKLAENKGYKKGDKIKWHIYGDKKFYTSKIVGFNKDPQNQNVTMTKKYLDSLGIKYVPDAIYTNKNLKKVTSIKNVDSIQDRDKLKEGMNDMLSMMRGMIILIIIVAIVLGAVIIVNLGTLSFTEKQYQFATLKVLGFKDKQIKKIFIKQNNWIAVLSIFAGCPLGFYLTDWLFKTAIEEHYDFGASIKIATYVFASIGTFVISYVVSKLLSRKVRKIDMVTSLKGNE